MKKVVSDPAERIACTVEGVKRPDAAVELFKVGGVPLAEAVAAPTVIAAAATANPTAAAALNR
jgi:hypothetical protein